MTLIIIGIIMFISGVALIRFLEPKADVRMIQLKTEPKIFALSLAFGGIAAFAIGLVMLFLK
jgi:hypothetical protein